MVQWFAIDLSANIFLLYPSNSFMTLASVTQKIM